jgi:hypothetical protein
MNHYCVCGHYPSEHVDNLRRCNGISYDTEFDSQFACVCPIYEKDSDE